jgi:hypothetical protein
MRGINIVCLLTLLPILGACVINEQTTIQHMVLIKLKNPDDHAALINDCNRLLPSIDGVSSYWCGTPDTSRRVSPTIDAHWDVALCVGYIDTDAYKAYVVDQAHVELVTHWKPKFEWLRIHDVSLYHSVDSQPTLWK